MGKRYRTIVADPPWPIVWTGGSRRAGASSGSTLSAAHYEEVLENWPLSCVRKIERVV